MSFTSVNYLITKFMIVIWFCQELLGKKNIFAVFSLLFSHAHWRIGFTLYQRLKRNMKQEDINIMMSHINSYSRLDLGDKTPYEVFAFLYREEIL